MPNNTVWPAERQPDTLFDKNQALLVTANKAGKLFGIAYEKEVPLLVKAPPKFFVYMTYNREIVSISMLQRVRIEGITEINKSWSAGTIGGLQFYVFVNIAGGYAYIWYVTTKHLLTLATPITDEIFDYLPSKDISVSTYFDVTKLPALEPLYTKMDGLQRTGFRCKGVDFLRLYMLINLEHYCDNINDLSDLSVEGNTIVFSDWLLTFTSEITCNCHDGFSMDMRTNSSASAIVVSKKKAVLANVESINLNGESLRPNVKAECKFISDACMSLLSSKSARELFSKDTVFDIQPWYEVHTKLASALGMM